MLLGDALGTPGLRRLQVAWALCSVGGWAFTVVLAVHAFDVGGAGAVAVAAAARTLPAAAADPFTGLLADRHSRRTVLPRAATVTAVTPIDHVALDRAHFLAAVTGNRRALAAADRIASQRQPTGQ